MLLVQQHLLTKEHQLTQSITQGLGHSASNQAAHLTTCEKGAHSLPEARLALLLLQHTSELILGQPFFQDKPRWSR